MNLTCPLNGRGVLVTRPAAQAEHLCQLIREAGGEPIAFPTLEIRATESAERARQLLAEPWDLMLFVSRNAVEYGMKLSPAGLHSGPDSEPARRPLLGAVGRATAAALREQGLAPDLVPARGFDSEALLALPALTRVGGKRVLIVRGEGGRPLLGETLRARGAEVAFAEVYRRSLPDVDVSAELSAWQARVGFITATSDEVLHNLLQLIGGANQAWLLSTPLVVISDRGGATAMQLGFRRVAVAEETSDEGLIDALCRLAMSR
ncbi:MAG: uroporphyrinogen-III synthase [Chromatiaceae bacterium]|nr:uroporphyrinogen-III synthase [Chromatiaceae bacterium]MCF7995856.1 uroporphyrinogen-III synthase [Chromatiaceae bacterium]